MNDVAATTDEQDWRSFTDESLELFRSLLQIDTTNPPGNEREAAELLADSLREDGYEPELLVPAPGRANLVARLPATHPGGGGPLLLTGHLDVVPADPARWRHDPFAAVEDDGYLYARGAIDMKNMVAMSAMVMKRFARLDLPRDRDLIFCAVSDEEEGCRWGSQWMVEEHPDKVRAEYMLGEIGGFPLDVMGSRFYPIQIAEKGICWLKLIVTGDPAHGSIPNPGSTTSRLARTLAKIASRRLPQHNTPVTEITLRTLAAQQKWPIRAALLSLLNPVASRALLPKLKPENLARNFEAMLSNTVNITRLEAGSKINSIPGEATAYLDGRLLPGQSEDDLKRELTPMLGPGMRLETLRTMPAVSTSPDGPLYESIIATLAKHDSTGIPLPTMIPGFTDAKFFSRLGTRCFGFSPIRWPAEDGVVFSKLFHGIDERAHVEGFRWGTQVLFETVQRFVSRGL